MTPVPRLWPGATIAILANGPSLTRADVDAVAGLRTIAIKDAIRLKPDADVLYACDAKWWKHYEKTLTFAGPRYALDPKAAPWATVLKNTGEVGLELNPSGLRTGKNSGFQAVNLAVHLGAARILLLGYDMRPVSGKHYWFGTHPYHTVENPYLHFRELFRTIVAPLKAAGVEVVNVTPGSALDAFPRVPLAQALEVAA